MNTREIAFIICKNKLLWYEECIRYIQDLYVPQDYRIDIITIEEAESEAAAYHAAMASSQAKYKVYLHEDVFILHKDFIVDILEIFQRDSTVGMVGMIGWQNIPVDGDGSLHWDTGRVFMYDGMYVQDQDMRKCQEQDQGYTVVEAVDNFLMVTQYDYRWQEEEMDEVYMYDIRQSREMHRHGKKTVVPWQDAPWCYHDCGVEQQAGSERNESKDQANRQGLNEACASLIRIAETGAFDVIWPVADEIRKMPDREIREIANLAEIYVLEKASVQGFFSQWWGLCSWSGLYEYYNQIRFVLLRMEYQREDERIELLKEMVRNRCLHRDAVRHLAGHTLPCADHVYDILLKQEREEPLVSVILPVYNGAEFVGKTIESVLAQTCKNIEVIIVDDASADGSREVIRSYADDRIKTVFCEKNRNIAYSGNLGFKEAKGKYIALIGHDDLWKPDKLEKQVAFLEDHPSYGVCFSYMDVIDEELRIQKESSLYDVFSRNNRTAEAWIRKLFTNGNCFCAPSACIRKSLLDKAGYYRYALLQLQDYDLWLRLFLEGEVYIYPEVLTLYRRFSNGNNLSVINSETRIRSFHESRYLRTSYIYRMPEEKFKKVFSKYMLDADAHKEKEILCEKAILLWNHGDASACDCFAELFEDEECRQILEEKYQIDLSRFYKLNALNI